MSWCSHLLNPNLHTYFKVQNPLLNLWLLQTEIFYLQICILKVPKIGCIHSTLKLSKKKLLFWVQGNEITHFWSILMVKTHFFQFRTHYFWRSKRGLKCHSMACKHYYALFGSKWSYSTQKNQNGFFQWSGHCALIRRSVAIPKILQH